MIKQVLIAAAGTLFLSLASAQAVDAVKESGKAAAQSSKEGGDQTKAAVHSGPEKELDKGKGQIHKAKSKYHRHKAKADANTAVH